MAYDLFPFAVLCLHDDIPGQFPFGFPQHVNVFHEPFLCNNIGYIPQIQPYQYTVPRFGIYQNNLNLLLNFLSGVPPQYQSFLPPRQDIYPPVPINPYPTPPPSPPNPPSPPPTPPPAPLPPTNTPPPSPPAPEPKPQHPGPPPPFAPTWWVAPGYEYVNSPLNWAPPPRCLPYASPLMDSLYRPMIYRTVIDQPFHQMAYYEEQRYQQNRFLNRSRRQNSYTINNRKENLSRSVGKARAMAALKNNKPWKTLIPTRPVSPWSVQETLPASHEEIKINKKKTDPFQDFKAINSAKQRVPLYERRAVGIYPHPPTVLLNPLRDYLKRSELLGDPSDIFIYLNSSLVDEIFNLSADEEETKRMDEAAEDQNIIAQLKCDKEFPKLLTPRRRKKKGPNKKKNPDCVTQQTNSYFEIRPPKKCIKGSKTYKKYTKWRKFSITSWSPIGSEQQVSRRRKFLVK